MNAHAQTVLYVFLIFAAYGALSLAIEWAGNRVHVLYGLAQAGRERLENRAARRLRK